MVSRRGFVSALLVGILLLFPGLGLYLWASPTRARFEELTFGRGCSVFEPVPGFIPFPGLLEECQVAYTSTLVGIILMVIGGILVAVSIILGATGRKG